MKRQTSDKISATFRLIKVKTEGAQINKIRNESREVPTGATEIQRVIKGYYKQLYTNKMDSLEEANP